MRSRGIEPSRDCTGRGWKGHGKHGASRDGIEPSRDCTGRDYADTNLHGILVSYTASTAVLPTVALTVLHASITAFHGMDELHSLIERGLQNHAYHFFMYYFLVDVFKIRTAVLL